MSKGDSKPTIRECILECLSDGEKKTAEIQAYVQETLGSKPNSVSKTLSDMTGRDEIKSPERGQYHLPTAHDAPAEAENSRGESENTETINKLLTLYDKLLDTVADSIEKEDWKGITEKIEAIKSLRWLGATVDQLMKRWYLLYRGYDTNTRQAVEDAKHKTENREKQEQENAPPEDQVVVVREYDESMRRALANLPGKDLKKRTV